MIPNPSISPVSSFPIFSITETLTDAPAASFIPLPRAHSSPIPSASLGQTCSNTASGCDSSGCVAQGPSALAEFTLSTAGIDYYDISIIGGVNVPVEISANLLDSTNTQSGAPYNCGNPGAYRLRSSCEREILV